MFRAGSYPGFFTIVTFQHTVAHQVCSEVHRFDTMSKKTKNEWAACIPVWHTQLADPKCSFTNRSWFINICRHGESFTEDKDFWILFLQRLQKIDGIDLSIAMSEAALFNNVKPFQHWEEANLHVEVATDVERAYYLSLLTRGVHPGLPLKLRNAGFEISDSSALLSFFPKTLEGFIPKKGCYWDGYHPEGLTIEHISQMYVDASKLQGFDESQAVNWLGKAFERLVEKYIEEKPWHIFESMVRPHFEKVVDWDLLGACYGVTPATRPSGQAQAALAYVGVTQDIEDPVQYALLSLTEPKRPVDMYRTLRGIANIEPESSYDVDSLLGGPLF